MGNTCQTSKLTELNYAHLYSDCNIEPAGCLMSHNTYCCHADDDCMDAFEYQRLEAEAAPAESNPFPDSACQLPRAAAAAEASTRRTQPSQPGHSLGKFLMRSPHTERAGPGPAAMAMAREEDDIMAMEDMHLDMMMPIPNSPSGRKTSQMSIQEAISNTGAEVVVHLYDLSEAFAQINKVAVDLIGFGGALHVGVEVFGVEWSFGTGGVSCSAPKQNRYFAYRQTVAMGRTLLGMQEVNRGVLAMQREWRGSDYDLFSKNCGTFCNALCVLLGVGSLPAWVTRLAETGANSTTVRSIADMMARNGMIGAPSPSVQSQISGSPCLTEGSPEAGCGSEFKTPPKQLDEEVLWLPSGSGSDGGLLQEEVDRDAKKSLPFNRFLSHTNSDGASPVRGSLLPQRCATFRAGASSFPHPGSALRPLSFDDKCKDDKEQAFCQKRLAVGPCPTYRTHHAIMALASSGGA